MATTSQPARQDEPGPPEGEVSPDIIPDTQKLADLYRAGAKLYDRDDLKRIETELYNFERLRSFTVRNIDGSTDSIGNHMFGIDWSI